LAIACRDTSADRTGKWQPLGKPRGFVLFAWYAVAAYIRPCMEDRRLYDRDSATE